MICTHWFYDQTFTNIHPEFRILILPRTCASCFDGPQRTRQALVPHLASMLDAHIHRQKLVPTTSLLRGYDALQASNQGSDMHCSEILTPSNHMGNGFHDNWVTLSPSSPARSSISFAWSSPCPHLLVSSVGRLSNQRTLCIGSLHQSHDANR